MKIKEEQSYLKVEGNHSNGDFSIEIGKTKDAFWTDGKFQMRFKDADVECYMNMTVDELKVLTEMINRVINENTKP